MLDDIFELTKEGMKDSIEALKRDFGTLRSGKVSISVLDNIKVDNYGALSPLNQVATVMTTDATTITITPWEKSKLGDIEKAIQVANIGVNPNNDGIAVKLFFPPMTSEQRQANVKLAKGMLEKSKISIRNVRKDSNNDIKSLEKDKDISEDEGKKGLDTIQKITDEMVKKAEDTFKAKEDELLKI
jgi:ribosome recycling factor